MFLRDFSDMFYGLAALIKPEERTADIENLLTELKTLFEENTFDKDTFGEFYKKVLQAADNTEAYPQLETDTSAFSPREKYSYLSNNLQALYELGLPNIGLSKGEADDEDEMPSLIYLRSQLVSRVDQKCTKVNESFQETQSEKTSSEKKEDTKQPTKHDEAILILLGCTTICEMYKTALEFPMFLCDGLYLSKLIKRISERRIKEPNTDAEAKIDEIQTEIREIKAQLNSMTQNINTIRDFVQNWVQIIKQDNENIKEVVIDLAIAHNRITEVIKSFDICNIDALQK